MRWIGLTAAALCIVAGCNERSDLIAAPPPGYREYVFEQRAASQIDFLWVIDNSESMVSVHDNMAANVSGFMDLLKSRRVDYRMAVINTDIFDARAGKGQFLTDAGDAGDPNSAAMYRTRVIRSTDTDRAPLLRFQDRLKALRNTSATGNEQAFEAAHMALEREKLTTAGVLIDRDKCLAKCQNATCREDCAKKNQPEFMRPDAHLYLVFVSDEPEQSSLEARYYARYFQQALGIGNEGAVSASAICGIAPCADTDTKGRFRALAHATSGLVAPICGDDFRTQLTALADDSVGLKRMFWLGGTVAVPETVSPQVRYRCDTKPKPACAEAEGGVDACAGRPLDYAGYYCEPPQSEVDGWTYEVKSNAVVFHGSGVPAHGTTIVVRFEAAEY